MSEEGQCPSVSVACPCTSARHDGWEPAADSTAAVSSAVHGARPVVTRSCGGCPAGVPLRRASRPRRPRYSEPSPTFPWLCSLPAVAVPSRCTALHCWAGFEASSVCSSASLFIVTPTKINRLFTWTGCARLRRDPRRPTFTSLWSSHKSVAANRRRPTTMSGGTVTTVSLTGLTSPLCSPSQCWAL